MPMQAAKGPGVRLMVAVVSDQNSDLYSAAGDGAIRPLLDPRFRGGQILNYQSITGDKLHDWVLDARKAVKAVGNVAWMVCKLVG